MDELSLRRFMNLFRGNQRSVGRWDPSKAKERQSSTDKEEATPERFSAHLDGGIGIGIVPIRDDGTCFWGAIDIDNHGQSEDIDIRAVERKVHKADLPLVACRSKSGGVHLYFFASEPVRADTLKQVLTRWAKNLEIEGTDCIYPKQGRLAVSHEGERALGNWINLPYWNADDSPRYAISNGKRLALEGFLSKAESIAVDALALQRYHMDDISEMPPCLQARMKSGGFSGGERNDGVYQIAVFCRKRDPDNAKAAAHELSIKLMPDAPLEYKEREKTIRSAMGRSYNYKCSSFKDVCDREACRKLKCGISEAEYESMSSRSAMPKFHSLVKYFNADPMRFDLKVGAEDDSRKIEGLSIDELSTFAEFRKFVMARTHTVLPRLKNDEWDTILRDLFANVSIESVPEDSTPEGAVRMRLMEFVRKADLKSEGDQKKDRDALLRGVPVVQLLDDAERVVMFRSIDFANYLQRTRTDVVKNKDLWFKVSRAMGIRNTRIRAGKSVIPVWYLPVKDIEEDVQHAADFKPEY